MVSRRVDAMLKTLELVRTPVYSFGGKGRTAITIYTVPKPEQATGDTRNTAPSQWRDATPVSD